jgi:hypothetical protein
LYPHSGQGREKSNFGTPLNLGITSPLAVGCAHRFPEKLVREPPLKDPRTPNSVDALPELDCESAIIADMALYKFHVELIGTAVHTERYLALQDWATRRGYQPCEPPEKAVCQLNLPLNAKRLKAWLGADIRSEIYDDVKVTVAEVRVIVA